MYLCVNVCLQAGKLGLDPVEVLLGPGHVDVGLGHVGHVGHVGPGHVDVGLGPQPARPPHLLGEGASVHLGRLQVPSI